MQNKQKRQFSWIEQTLASITLTIERAVFNEEHARLNGLLQRLDPRAKLIMALALILTAGFLHALTALLALYLVILALAAASRLPFDFFVKRVWMGIPLFTGLVILPATFFTGEPRLFDLPLGPFHFGPSLTSLYSAAVFITRVMVSVSLAVSLILTTPWADVLHSLHVLRVPQVFILVLAMTYRYIFLFLHTVNGMFEARKSRMVGYSSGQEQRRWISSSLVSLLHRSFKMSTDVYAAMVARGFQGEIRGYHRYRMAFPDWLALLCTAMLASALLLSERLLL